MLCYSRKRQSLYEKSGTPQGHNYEVGGTFTSHNSEHYQAEKPRKFIRKRHFSPTFAPNFQEKKILVKLDCFMVRKECEKSHKLYRKSREKARFRKIFVFTTIHIIFVVFQTKIIIISRNLP